VTRTSGSGGGAKGLRDARLAAALKANLQRRKVAARQEPASSDRPPDDEGEPAGAERASCQSPEAAGTDEAL
jgi:hypothetical protein